MLDDMRLRTLTTLFAPAVLAACTTTIPNTSTSSHDVTCPPPAVFQNAVCSCEDLAHVGELHVEPGPGGTGSIGVDGATQLVGASDISGTLYSWGGVGGVGCSIGDSLVTPKDVDFTGDATIHGDAVIGGNLTAVGQLDVGGQLEVGGTSEVLGGGTIASRAPYQAPGAAPPCDCDPSHFFDVAGAVAAAKQLAGGQASWTSVGVADIHLQTGSYYVTAADVVGKTTIHVDGNVSVFVDGSLDAVGATRWQLASGAQLDLFVSGDVASVGQLAAGDPNAPDAFRLYVGGSGGVTVGAVGESQFYGAIYAPQANVLYVGDAHIVGSIFAKSIQGVGRLEIDYGDAATPPSSCTPPAPPSGSGAGSGSGSGSNPAPIS